MTRHILAAAAFVLCVLAGLGKCRTAKRRCELLSELVRMLSGFSVRIRCTAPTLEELIGEDSGIFAQLVREELRSGCIRSAWVAACERLRALPYCREEEAALLKKLGQSLGRSDREGEICTLNLYGEQLSALSEAAREEYSRKGRMFRSVGALCGLGAAIMIW